MKLGLKKFKIRLSSFKEKGCIIREVTVSKVSIIRKGNAFNNEREGVIPNDIGWGIRGANKKGRGQGTTLSNGSEKGERIRKGVVDINLRRGILKKNLKTVTKNGGKQKASSIIRIKSHSIQS